MKLSVAMISFNEEENIARTIEAVKNVADEIVLIDSFSTDKTVEIAEKLGAKVYSEEWKGFAAQKNSAAEKCGGEWILFLDCDEEITPELADSITKAVDTGEFDGYSLNRRTFYMGRLLKYAWQPDFKLRLVKKDSSPLWEGEYVHETLSLKGSAKGRLSGYLIHYSYKNFTDHMQRTLTYSTLAAKKYLEKGRKIGAASFIFRPWFDFFKALILKRSFLDGIPGIIAAFSYALATYSKYAYLWEMQKRDQEQ